MRNGKKNLVLHKSFMHSVIDYDSRRVNAHACPPLVAGANNPEKSKSTDRCVRECIAPSSTLLRSTLHLPQFSNLKNDHTILVSPECKSASATENLYVSPSKLTIPSTLHPAEAESRKALSSLHQNKIYNPSVAYLLFLFFRSARVCVCCRP